MDWRKDLGFDRDNPNFGEICPFRLGPKRILCFKSRKFTELSLKLEPNFFSKMNPRILDWREYECNQTKSKK